MHLAKTTNIRVSLRLFSLPDLRFITIRTRTNSTRSERPPKELDSTNSWNFTLQQVSPPDSSSPRNMLSFGNCTSSIYPQYYGTSDCVNPKKEVVSGATKNLVSGNRLSHGSSINPINSPDAGQGNKRAISPS